MEQREGNPFSIWGNLRIKLCPFSPKGKEFSESLKEKAIKKLTKSTTYAFEARFGQSFLENKTKETSEKLFNLKILQIFTFALNLRYKELSYQFNGTSKWENDTKADLSVATLATTEK